MTPSLAFMHSYFTILFALCRHGGGLFAACAFCPFSGPALLTQFKVYLARLHICGNGLYPHAVANAELPAPTAHQTVMLFLKEVSVAQQRCNTHQALDGIGQLHKEALLHNARDDALKFLAQMIPHIFALLQIICRPLRLNCGYFPVRAVIGSLGEP